LTLAGMCTPVLLNVPIMYVAKDFAIVNNSSKNIPTTLLINNDIAVIKSLFESSISKLIRGLGAGRA